MTPFPKNIWHAVAAALPLVSAASIVNRNQVATVDLARLNGAPAQLASAFIYGLPSNEDGSPNFDIPSELVEGFGFNYCRAGGAQIAEHLGWVAGQYEGRWASALSNYRTTRHYGGRFTLLLHDLWGADSLQAPSFEFPGQNGDWSNHDAFLDQVFKDIRDNDMFEGLDIDIWNEPDGKNFWNAPQTQYLEMWDRTWRRIRNELPSTLITGPSTAVPVTYDNEWWQNYVKFIADTQTAPDIYSWHLLDPSRNLRESDEQFERYKSEFNLPDGEKNINEYAANDAEQSPAGSVFYIAQLERFNIPGLRANWASGPVLRDLMANTLIKNSNGQYQPTGEWHLYNYYNSEMVGERVLTQPSDDELFEAYATHDGTQQSVKIIAAIRPIAGLKSYDLKVTGLDSLNITGGVIRVRTLRFDGPDRGTAIEGPVDLGIVDHQVNNNEIRFWVAAEQITTAYAFEFVL